MVYAVWGYDADKDGRPDVYGDEYVIYSAAGENGSVDPDGTTFVQESGSQAFKFTPTEQYAVDKIILDGTVHLNDGTLELAGYDAANGIYTFSAVKTDHTIVVTFALDVDGDGLPDKYDPDIPDPAPTCTVTYKANGGSGSDIQKTYSQNTVVTVAENTFTYSGHSFDGWNTAENGSGTAYRPGETFSLNGNLTLYAQWRSSGGGGGGGTTRYTITASAGDGGSISPDGRVRVSRGTDKTFTVKADEGYVISDVLVDGKSVGAVKRYTFENVRKSHTIEAVFEREQGVTARTISGVSSWLNTKDHAAYMAGYDNGKLRAG